MDIILHPHAVVRLSERGATETEAIETLHVGEQFPAKFGRTGFRHNFNFDGEWCGKHYNTKQLEAYAVAENGGWTIITVIVKYF